MKIQSAVLAMFASLVCPGALVLGASADEARTDAAPFTDPADIGDLGDATDRDAVEGFYEGTIDSTLEFPGRGASQVKIVIDLGPKFDWSNCRLRVYVNGAISDEIGGLSGIRCSQATRIKSQQHEGPAEPAKLGTYRAQMFGAPLKKHMHYAVYFQKPMYAIHAGNLNSGSHGCIRVSEANAIAIYGLVKSIGLGNTTIVLRNARSTRPGI